MIAAAIEQHGNVNILRQPKNAENKTERHKNNQHHGNAIDSAGGMPDECAEDNDKQNGRQFAVQPNQRRQNHACRCNVSIKKDAADEINGDIVDGIGAAAKHIMRHRIERNANVIAFIGFEQTLAMIQAPPKTEGCLFMCVSCFLSKKGGVVRTTPRQFMLNRLL